MFLKLTARDIQRSEAEFTRTAQERRGCTGKISYETRANALSVARKCETLKGGSFDAYRCRYNSAHWHLTSRKSARHNSIALDLKQ